MQPMTLNTKTTALPTTVAPRSLADLKVFVQADASLTPQRRRDLASAISSLGTFLGEPLEALPADGRRLRHRVEQLHHEHLGVSKKRLDNVVGGVRAALKRASRAFPGVRYAGQLDPAWQDLRNRLAQKSKYLFHLSRAIRFFSDQGIAPAAVDDAAFARFKADLGGHSLRKDPWKGYQPACRWWNHAVTEIEGWPRTRVTVPSYKPAPKTLPLDAFPPTFGADLARCRACLLDPNPLRDKTDRSTRGRGPKATASAYAASTAYQWIAMLHRAASVLVRDGVCAIEQVTGVDVLCRPDHAEAVLLHYWEAAGGAPTPYTALLAKVFRLVAERYLAADAEHLDDLAANVEPMSPKETGLTAKNARRLRQFNEPANKRLFLEAPERLWRAAEAQDVRRKQDAIDLMMAAASAILMFAPLRIGNLTTLSLARHIRWPARRGGPAYLHIPSGEVKNDQELDFALPPETVALLRAYLEEARCWWFGPEDDRLFPFGGDAQSRRYFGQLLSQRLRRVTGLEINAHLSRHIMAKLYLDAHPGDYETVRLLLGHTQLKTTVQFYCGMERDAAIQHYDATVLGVKETLQQSQEARPGPRRRGSNNKGG